MSYRNHRNWGKRFSCDIVQYLSDLRLIGTRGFDAQLTPRSVLNGNLLLDNRPPIVTAVSLHFLEASLLRLPIPLHSFLYYNKSSGVLLSQTI